MTISSIKDFLRNHIVFLSVLTIFVGKFLFLDFFSRNEQEVLVYAKHFVDGDWIKNDWYLNLGIEYRNLFNFIAGGMSLFLPLYLVSIVGRFFVYSLFAFLIQSYARLFKIPAYLIIPFIYFFLRFQFITAGEWMLGGFESKNFAYFFILLSLYYFMEKRYWQTWLFLGLSISFHILVGLYASFCMAITFLINYDEYRRDLNAIIKNLYLFFLGGFNGFLVAAKYLLYDLDLGVSSRLVGEIYVLKRAPHHTYPPFWTWPNWLITIIIFCIPLLIIFFWFKERKYKVVSSFALSSLVLFFTGLFIFIIGAIHLLKYYWFRFPDTIIPFFGLFAATIIVNKLLEKIALTSHKLYQGAVALGVSLSLLIVVSYSIEAVTRFSNLMKQGEYFYLADQDKHLIDALLWIRQNTEKEATFLVAPNLSKFYIGAERPVFVTYKHAPHSNKGFIEWYYRVKLCNNLGEINYWNREKLENNFYDLKDEIITYLTSNYSLDYFLTKKNKRYSLPIIYENEKFILYSLKSFKNPPNGFLRPSDQGHLQSPSGTF